MDLKGFIFVPFYSPFLAVRRSTIFWCSVSLSCFLNFDPSLYTPRLNNLLISSPLKSIHCPLTYTLFHSLSTIFAKNSLTKEAHSGSLCSARDFHSLFSTISAKGEIIFLNPLSAMKPLFFNFLPSKLLPFLKLNSLLWLHFLPFFFLGSSIV